MSITDQLCETNGCKNRGMKFERDGKYLCKKCARIYDGKAPLEDEEEKKLRLKESEEEEDE